MGLGGERLARFQFFHIVRQLKSEFFSGEARARARNESITVRFSEGEPVDALSDSMKYSFPAFLLDRKLIGREQTARLLDTSSRKGMKLEETLVEDKIFSEKQIRRLKAEQSRRLFQMLFEADDFVWSRLDAGVHETLERPFRLDPYEALFMAVSRAEDTETMAMFFADRWDTQVRKTGELYRHMIQFRSVFFDEEVLETLLAGDATVSEILSRANDQQTALRQCYALCYTGMLTFAEEAGEGFRRASVRSSGAADIESEDQVEAGQTVMFMPEQIEAVKSRRTQFIGTRPDLDREAAEAEHSTGPVEEVVEEPVAPSPEWPPGKYTFPGAVWGGGEPLAEKPGKPDPAPDPAPEPAQTSEKPARSETAFGAPVVAAPARPTPPVQRQVITPPPATPQSAPQNPETVDDILRMALQEAEQAIGRLGPQDTARLTHEGAHFGGSSNIDFSDLMLRTRGGETSKIRDMVREPGTRPVDPSKPEPPKPEAPKPGPTSSPRPPSPPDDIPGGFEAKVFPPSTLEVPRAHDESSPDSPEAPAVVQALPALPPRGLPEPNTDDHIEELLAKEYEEMRSKGFYGVLGVDSVSQLSQIRNAHALLKHRYSAENFRSYVLSERARKILALILSALDRSRSMLINRNERRIYDERNGTRYPEPAENVYSRLFDADEFFQQARRRMKMTHWVEAYNLLGRAVELNPLESEYLAYRAWSLFQGYKSGQIRDDFAPNKARQLLDKALNTHDRCERSLYYRARLEHSLGNNDDAATSYARLLRVNPHHPSAKDELNALTRPRGKKTSTPDPVKRGFRAWFKALFTG